MPMSRRSWVLDSDPRLHIWSELEFPCKGLITSYYVNVDTPGSFFVSLWEKLSEGYNYITSQQIVVSTPGIHHVQIQERYQMKVMPGYILGTHYSDGSASQVFPYLDSEWNIQVPGFSVVNMTTVHIYNKYEYDISGSVTIQSAAMTRQRLPLLQPLIEKGL